MLRHLFSVAAIVAAGLFVAEVWAAEAEKLGPGDPAPELKVEKFLKGDEISKFEKGRVYVVECWATWCGPCLQSIPHLTELQKENPKITVVGVCVSDPDIDAIEEFVKGQGDEMGYTVAWEGKSGRGKPAPFTKAWLNPSGAEGIPHAFVVDGKGVVAWMGHPMEMDEPLKKIIAGDWDAKAYGEKLALEREAQAKLAATMEEFGAKLDELEQAGDTDGMLAVFDEYESKSPDLALNCKLGRAKILLSKKKYAAKAEKHLTETIGDPENTEPAVLFNTLRFAFEAEDAEGLTRAAAIWTPKTKEILLAAARHEALAKLSPVNAAVFQAKAEVVDGHKEKAAQILEDAAEAITDPRQGRFKLMLRNMAKQLSE